MRDLALAINKVFPRVVRRTNYALEHLRMKNFGLERCFLDTPGARPLPDKIERIALGQPGGASRLSRFPVDGGDLVAWPQARLLCGAAGSHRPDNQGCRA